MKLTPGEKFKGFPSTALSFLEELKANNNREWFEPRKAIYESQLKQPMEQLVHEISTACRAQGVALLPKERSAVSRIYRDIRFSKDKSPFHGHVCGLLTGQSGIGEMCILLSSEQSFVATGFYMPEPALLNRMRDRIATKPDVLLECVQALRAKRLELVDEWKLKKMPRGFERLAGSAVAEFLKLNCLIVRRWLAAGELASPALVRNIAKFAIDARPLLEFGWTAAAGSIRGRAAKTG